MTVRAMQMDDATYAVALAAARRGKLTAPATPADPEDDIALSHGVSFAPIPQVPVKQAMDMTEAEYSAALTKLKIRLR